MVDLKKLPNHLQNGSRLGGIWYERDLGRSIDYIAYCECTTPEIIKDILENYDDYQKQIRGW